MKQTIRFLFFVLFLAAPVISVLALQRTQVFFNKSTFEQFAYPDAELDEAHTNAIKQQSMVQFKKARERLVKSYVTLDKPRKVVSYYANLCGKRFQKRGERFTYVFSEIDGQPATRIEIYPAAMGKMHREFWPTRIDLYIIRYPLTVDIELEEGRSLERLEERIGRYVYENGSLKEDIALLYTEELGSDSEVFVIETDDDFQTVYNYFRRRHGGIRVHTASDGDLLTRDFEVDISRALGPDDQDKELHLFVEENPLIADPTGNALLYNNKVFIRYVFWKKKETPTY
jgi:hypothetical protein